LTNNKRWIFKWKACCTKQAIARKFDAEELQMYRGIVTWGFLWRRINFDCKI